MLALALGHELIRLQCYEGLDEAKALYEWEYAKQLLYTQILKDKIGEVLVGAQGAGRGGRSNRQRGRGVLLRALHPAPAAAQGDHQRPSRSVLLIDEIDKADAEFEAFLLEVLSRLPGDRAGAGNAAAKHIPLVVLTSNNAREMSDALKRRCLHLYIDFPDRAQELAIVKLKVPEASQTARRTKSSPWCSRSASST